MNTAEFLKKLEPDFSNIDEVYNELLKEYNPDNIERSELMFINSFDFDNTDDDDVNATKLSHYLGKKVSKINWQNIDYYNRYLETKEFNIGYFSFLANKGKKDFKETNLEFNRTFERFEFIYNRLENINKLELKSIFLETLNFHKTNIQKLRFKPLIENLIQRVESIETASENNKPDEVKTKHPNHNPNYWNKDCFELFKYLFDNYYKTTKRELTNIWFYLKETGNDKYVLKATKDQYKEFIFENYNKRISNFDKAIQKWEDKEKFTIKEHRMNFETNLR